MLDSSPMSSCALRFSYPTSSCTLRFSCPTCFRASRTVLLTLVLQMSRALRAPVLCALCLARLSVPISAFVLSCSPALRGFFKIDFWLVSCSGKFTIFRAWDRWGTREHRAREHPRQKYVRQKKRTRETRGM